MIEGKRCWYKGARRISKSRLAWRVAPKAKPTVIKPAPPDPDEADRVIWPQPDVTFEDRWKGLR